VHVIHLGDVYFAGEPEEYRDHVLANNWWPVSAEQAAAGVGSWALAGNHDLYGGARAYFTVMLADPRFALQRSNGKPTSWFRLTSPSWEIIGIDTSWNDDPFEKGQTGLLQDPQVTQIAEWVADHGEARQSRKRLILSHHQLLTVYDTRLRSVLDQGREPVLHTKMADTLNAGAITAWIWGHEHRCMAFADSRIAFPRCLGHGGQLQQAHDPGAKPPHPGTWEETAQFQDAGLRWGSFGFAVLDLHEPDDDGSYIDVTYHLDGAQPVVATERVG
jgi:Calcineurin-like phosphoesterase